MALAPSSGRPTRASSRAIIATGLTAILSIAGGCTTLVDTEPQCSADADCKKFGYEFTCEASACKGAAVPCYEPTGMGGHGCYQSAVAGCFDPATGPTLSQTLNACMTADCFEPAPLSVSPAILPALPTSSPPGVEPPAFEVGSTTTPCSIFGKPVVVVAGTSTGAALLSEISAAVNPAFVVAYVPMSSCDAISVAAQKTALSGFAWYWDPVFTATIPSARRLCKLADNTAPAMIISDLEPSTCDPSLGRGVPDWQATVGPVSYLSVAVPERSSVSAITQETATSIFAFGAEPRFGVTVPPFTNAAAILMDSSVGWLVPSLAPKRIGYGTWKSDSTSVAAAVTALGSEDAIGIMRGEVVDLAGLRPLAFRATGQGCAVLPDSATGKSDRANVRDGHYPLWFSSRILSRMAGGAVDPNAQIMLDAIEGKELTGEMLATRPTWDVFARYQERHMIPTCAMRVRKQGDADFGTLTPYQPPLGCGCHFDDVGARTSCQTCKGDTECPAGQVCARWGTSTSKRYCEPKLP